MTGRERTLAAMRREPTDRTPFFEKLIKSPHAEALLGRPCAASNFDVQMEHLAEGAWEELQLQAARDVVDLSELLGFDLVPQGLCGAPPESRPERLSPTTWRWEGQEFETLPTGWVKRRPIDEQPRKSPEEEERELIAGLEAGWTVEPVPESSYLRLREVKRLLRERNLDLAIFGWDYALGPAAAGAVILRWFAERPPALELLCRRALELNLPAVEALAREGVQVIGLGGDVACDHGPIISPSAYHDYVTPVMRDLSRKAHELGAFTTMASDGDTWALLDEFLVHAETDGFEEIDYAAGMRIDQIHQKYETCCIGNLDIRFVLTRGTPEEVRVHVREVLDAGQGRAGGHILMSSNCLHEDVKLPLFLEAVAAYREYFGMERLSV
jgi:hypothetical protein